MTRTKKIVLAVLGIGLGLLCGMFLFATFSHVYYGLKPSLRINECTVPVSISGKLPENAVLSSREDFVDFIKSHQMNLHTRSISQDLTLDSFIKQNEINWVDVLDATKIHFGFPPEKSYVLEYKPKPKSCRWATFSITTDGKYYDIFGCCGDIEKLQPGETRTGYGSFPKE